MINQEPKFRPYTYEEFQQALLVHGGYATTKDGKIINHVEIADKYGIFNSSSKAKRFSFEKLLDLFVWMDDGSPCGIYHKKCGEDIISHRQEPINEEELARQYAENSLFGGKTKKQVAYTAYLKGLRKALEK